MTEIEEVLKGLLLEIGCPYREESGWDYCRFCSAQVRNMNNIDPYSPKNHADDCPWMRAFRVMHIDDPGFILNEWREQHIG